MSETFAKDIDECSLCLTVAEKPVVCQKGHIFCKSCIYDNLLTQKERYKQNLHAYEEQCAEDQRRLELAKQEEMLKDTLTFQSIDTSITGTVQDRVVASTFSSLTGKISSIDALQLNNASQIKDMTGFAPEAPKGYRAVPTGDGNYAFVRCGDTGASWTLMEGKKEHARLEKPNSDCICPAGSHTLKVKHLASAYFTPYNDVSKDSINIMRKKASIENSQSLSSGQPSNSTTSTALINASAGATSNGVKAPVTSLVQTDDDAAYIRDVNKARKARHMCPCCLRGLTKHTKTICVRRCGHVLCYNCYDMCMLKPAKANKDQKKDAESSLGDNKSKIAGKADKKDKKRDASKEQSLSMSCAECDVACWGDDIVVLCIGTGTGTDTGTGKTSVSAKAFAS